MKSATIFTVSFTVLMALDAFLEMLSNLLANFWTLEKNFGDPRILFLIFRIIEADTSY